jgi:hypothetical protein
MNSPEYIKQLKFFVLKSNLKQSISYLNEIKKNGKGYIWIFFDYLSMLRKGFITFSEYYKYEFEKQDATFRNSFLGSVNVNKYYRQLNPSHSKIIAKNKFVAHCVLGTIGIPKANLLLYYNPDTKTSNDIIASDYMNATQILKAQHVADFVVKPAFGLLGKDIHYFNKLEYHDNNILLNSSNGLTIYLSDLLKHEHLIFESHVEQSKQFSEFNPSSVNCLRFMTALNPDGKVKIIGTTIKVGRENSFVDNASQGGNINAAVDLLNGKIYNVYHFQGFRKIKPITHHPDTRTILDGVIIKNWEIIKAKVISFHENIPYLKVIGWDIAITESGPKVIELNCEAAITPQLFIGKGWKNEIKDCYKKWLNY